MDSIIRMNAWNSIEGALKSLDGHGGPPIVRNGLMMHEFSRVAHELHLEIEKCLKIVINELRGTPNTLIETHDVFSLYDDFKKLDGEDACELDDEFEKAVEYFGYNRNRDGYGHVASLRQYLVDTASGLMFNDLRYWSTGDGPSGTGDFYAIQLPLHRELLCALKWRVSGERREHVYDRVNTQIHMTVFENVKRCLVYPVGDREREQIVKDFGSWLTSNPTDYLATIRDAVDREFVVSPDEQINAGVRLAYQSLTESSDPAVWYGISTISYLPSGSYRIIPGAVPKWTEPITGRFVRRAVETPAGQWLGIVDRYPDGAWAAHPIMDTKFIIAREFADAKNWLVHEYTDVMDVEINDESRRLRYVPGRNKFIREKTDLVLWDSDHGIDCGDQMRFQRPNEDFPQYGMRFDGVVKSVCGHEVSLEGNAVLDLMDQSAPV